jgi:hypothetical protein
MGGNVFCGRACGHAFLFGDEDVDESVREEE